VSLANLLTELAVNAERDDAYQSERKATQADAGNPAALAEERIWEATLGDGIIDR
jgi:hypothetical protein